MSGGQLLITGHFDHSFKKSFCLCIGHPLFRINYSILCILSNLIHFEALLSEEKKVPEAVCIMSFLVVLHPNKDLV